MNNLDLFSKGLTNIHELTLFDGIFHGFVFSLPFSAPLLICISRFLIQGFIPGIIALLGTLLGQLSFFFFICSNFRGLLSFWYSLEPFLALVGAILAFCFATNFWSEGGLSFGSSFRETTNDNFWNKFAGKIFGLSLFSRISNSTGFFATGGKTSFGISLVQNLKIFSFNFLLMFLNPAMPSTSTRVIFSSPLLFGQYNLFYILGFIGTSIFAIGLIWPLIFSFGIQIIQKGGYFVSQQNIWSNEIAGNLFSPEKNQSSQNNSSATQERKKINNFLSAISFNWTPSAKASRFLSFLIIGCVLSGTLQYSWRLFTQYPLEAIISAKPAYSTSSLLENTKLDSSFSNAASEKSSQNEGISLEERGNLQGVNQTKNPSLLREFPAFDSNIRHREKNLPIDRFLPIEKMNARRILSDRPPLTEEQKSDAYFKFHSFFINSLEKYFDNKIIFSRLPEKQNRSYYQIQYLQQLKNQFTENKNTKGTLLRNKGFEPLLARPLENNTKGKRPQGFSYVRDLVSSESTDNYMHDELQIYRALFRPGS